jgi:hypothetical protein|tara:strand:- start:436 stop:582 length:147 start_codon:yes stop_codon:yes gene_type:complete
MDKGTEDILVRIAQALEKLAGINDNEDREWEQELRASAAIERALMEEE